MRKPSPILFNRSLDVDRSSFDSGAAIRGVKKIPRSTKAQGKTYRSPSSRDAVCWRPRHPRPAASMKLNLNIVILSKTRSTSSGHLIVNPLTTPTTCTCLMSWRAETRNDLKADRTPRVDDVPDKRAWAKSTAIGLATNISISPATAEPSPSSHLRQDPSGPPVYPGLHKLQATPSRPGAQVPFSSMQVSALTHL